MSYSSLRGFVEQNILTFHFPHGRGGGGGLQGFLPRQISAASSSHSSGAVVRLLHGVFAIFPKIKKSARVGSALRVGTDHGVEPIHVACLWRARGARGGRVGVLEAESEEEDPDKLVDEFGRRWFRSEVFPGRWFLLCTSSDGVVWWDEPGWGSRPSDHAATSFSSWGALFLDMPVVVQRQVPGQWIRLSWSSGSSCVNPRMLLEEFWFACSRSSHFEIWSIICPGLVSESYLFYVWVLPCGIRKMDLLGDDFSECATPDSTVDTCYASVHLAFGRIVQYFQWIWTRILRRFSPFSRRMEKCAQSMPQVMAHACAACA